MAHNVSAKPDARREARVPKAKPRSGAAGFACYALRADGSSGYVVSIVVCTLNGRSIIDRHLASSEAACQRRQT